MNPIIKALLIVSVLWIDLVTMGEIFTVPPVIDKELYGYVDQFLDDAKRHHVWVDPYLIGRLEYADEMDGRDIGETIFPTRFGHTLRIPFAGTVYIHSKLEPDIYKKATVYHELGHCLLGLDHDPDPNQIMYFEIPPPSVLEKNWDAMVDHLFATPRP